MVGKTISHYEILDKLGAGGMGEVYRARDTTLDREIALKVLPVEFAADPKRLARFEREARTLASLDHPSIVSIHSVEEADGVHFLTMQLVDGKRLSELIPRGGMPLERIFEIAIPLADALAAAHERGVIHRDLKPDNIMVAGEGRVKVLDFGLAKLRAESTPEEVTDLATEPLTMDGRIAGTVPYMSPEQLEGKKLDARSDIFSLGVILYEMATEERPFKGETSPSLIMAIARDTPPAVDLLREELPHHLGRLIGRCLEKEPKRRYQSAIDVQNELEGLRRESQAEASPRVVEQERFPRLRLIAGMAALLLALSAAGLYLSRRPSGPSAGERRIESLAVLPLDNLMNDSEQDYFVDGMTEALITDLAKVSALKVISRTSVMGYKERDESIPEIAEALGVDAVIEGSVLRVGDEVRIAAQLIDGRTDEHLWAESYTRELENVLELHGEVARAIADEIEVAVTSDEAGRLAGPRQVVPKALQAYLKGQYSWNKRTAEGFDEALAFFRQAIELDPDYSLAHSGLANTYNLLGEYELWTRQAYAEAKAAALKAIDLDPTSADAWIAMAWVLIAYEWDWANAERHFERAIELNPSSSLAHHWYAELLMFIGRHEDALTRIRLAQELDPLSLITNAVEGRVLLYARQYDQAIERLEQVLDMDPSFPMARAYLGNVYIEKGMYQEAFVEWEIAAALFGDDELWTDNFAYAHLAAGRRDQALLILEELKSREPPRPYDLARLSAAMGKREEALAWLERGYEARADGMRYLKVDPGLDSLRDDPRFKDLLRRMNFPE